MKKIISISLSIFLVMGAVVLFTGGMQANAQSVSKAWTGQWSCSATSESNPNHNFVRTETIRYLTINSDGTESGTDWYLYQVDGDWVGGETYSFLGTVTEEKFPTIGYSWSSVHAGSQYSGSGRCIGKNMDQDTGAFNEATCINAVVIDNLNDYIEQIECERTVTPQ